ncbi:MAG TPA: PLDc N-terminal domain-containing protein [Anaerolineaceae bacterium]|nr:PLDc N-terminal domain-containing protein [Anaerolineaceae bacterium]HOD45502.1 PLDc N-terminal domain-containing protein [Anaerolineaceae bacterium]HOH21006.1 PLDc N-terminal domain-containing protein [Anaerolineaceae bacterium]HOU44725.1 PLDc N-terminal domain-containing protein [Anaerolineaceae bacterium]HPA34296.1 PLDc N-terminal domain-containing protein [Anaerolineaceae bacterium]
MSMFWSSIPVILTLTALIAWIALGFYALFELRNYRISSVAKALWTIIILLVPVFGAVAFLVVRPTDPA